MVRPAPKPKATALLAVVGTRRAYSFTPAFALTRSAASVTGPHRAVALRRLPRRYSPSSAAAKMTRTMRPRHSAGSPLLRDAPAERYSSFSPDDGGSERNPSSPSLECTPLPSIPLLVESARAAFHSGVTRPYEFRMDQLRGVERLVRENSEGISRALAADLGQGPMYAEGFELTHVVSHSRHARKNLRDWMQTSSYPTPFPVNLNIPVHSELEPMPRGVVLMITPWNMPVQLNFNPLIDALAAGNVCVLKMSEQCVRTTALFTRLLSEGRYVDERAIRIVNGGAEEATKLLEQRWDAIMYTGGGKVGKIVAQAAAKNLTPVLLELGGKNPVFVTKNAHIPSAAMRIAWGKITSNAGQMCICPDYVLVEECIKDEFVEELCKAMDRMYPVSSYTVGDGFHGRSDVGKMISVDHAQRVVNMIDSTSKIIYGGKHHNVKERFVAPTIVEANDDSTIMKEEIFGPILAIQTSPNLDNAIDRVRHRHTLRGEHPLVMYVFSKSKAEQRRIMEAVPSGACAVNEVIKQTANYHLPFGGVGASGMGAYYGKWGFDFFSHQRGTLVGNNYSTSRWDPSVWMAHPPFNDRKLSAFRLVSRVPLLLDTMRRFVLPIVRVGFPIAFVAMCFLDPKFLDALLELNLKTIFGWVSQMWK